MSTQPPRKRARTTRSTAATAIAIRSDLNYIQYPTYQDDIKDYYTDYIRPRHVAGDGKSVIIEIDGGGFSIPFDECRMTCAYKIEKKVAGEWVKVVHEATPGAADGTDTTLAPIQNILESLFKQYDISVNGKIISETSNMFPYIGHIVKLLNYSPMAKSTYLTLAGWHTDTASPDDTTNANLGWKARRARSY